MVSSNASRVVSDGICRQRDAQSEIVAVIVVAVPLLERERERERLDRRVGGWDSKGPSLCRAHNF